jgi:hypothetical protein
MLFNLGTSLTIANAGEIKQALLGLVQANQAITLDASALIEVDVAGLQLLCATHRFATAQGKSVDWAGGRRAGLVQAAAGAGFAGQGRGCAASCLCNGNGGQR